ncbi:MAG: alpha/beta hydrolase [Nocardioidaceae bacterium]
MSESANARGAVTRRGLLLGGVGLGVAAGAGAVGWTSLPQRCKVRLGVESAEDAFIPAAAEGQVRLETVRSAARGGKDVQLFTAVPAGHGDGAGLPVVVVLHGASATAADFQEIGLGHFLTAAVQAGAPPFVLAGADGGVLRWEPDPTSDDDPQAMVVDEVPGWLTERGFDASRRALWGWSMGGYGVLRVAELYPAWCNAVAVFSPAIGAGDSVFTDEDRLGELPLGLWCGTDDGFYPAVSDFVEALPTPPQVASFTAGAHTRTFWNDHTLEAFGYLSSHLDD